MEFTHYFKNAKWVTAENAPSPIIRKDFYIDEVKKATINIVGFASFNLFVNGVRVGDDYFLPFATDYEDRTSPRGEVLGHRIYVTTYELTSLLKNGKNTLAVHLGCGYYTGDTGIYKEVPYGEKKLVFLLNVEDSLGARDIISDEELLYVDSFVTENDLNFGETHDYTDYSPELLLPDCPEEKLKSVKLSTAPVTEYLSTDCPPDRICERIIPTVVKKDSDGTIYDAGKNITGFPVILSKEGANTVEVLFSEALSDGSLAARNSHKQKLICKTGGKEVRISPAFTWFGFRYFHVKGDADVLEVLNVHADVKVSSYFESDSEVLNWLYNAFVHTELSNMHQGIPSDCPHIERRGYTGDGQLTAHAAMLTLDAEAFYRKWIYDISDCQDRLTGHVQYTAPYTHSGGGPGGWGSAIVKLPHEFFKRFGDDSLIKELYPAMLSYFKYLDSHSECDLVTSDIEGEWCLGEWCVPKKHPGDTVLPPAFVNSYFYVKALEMATEIATYLGYDRDVEQFREKTLRIKKALTAAYYNPNNHNFLGGYEGANAFMLDIGLGDEVTKKNFIEYYEASHFYDTGIFGTEIVTRLLFEYNRADIASKLLTEDTPHGFGKWYRDGATSLYEYWNSPRSMSHPMFGAVAAHLFDYLLGIRNKEGSVGYRDVCVSPAKDTPFSFVRGYISTSRGRISVDYKKDDKESRLTVEIPDGVRCDIHFFDEIFTNEGSGRIEIHEKNGVLSKIQG